MALVATIGVLLDGFPVYVPSRHAARRRLLVRTAPIRSMFEISFRFSTMLSRVEISSEAIFPAASVKQRQLQKGIAFDRPWVACTV
jgi:hypothetical protein